MKTLDLVQGFIDKHAKAKGSCNCKDILHMVEDVPVTSAASTVIIIKCEKCKKVQGVIPLFF